MVSQMFPLCTICYFVIFAINTLYISLQAIKVPQVDRWSRTEARLCALTCWPVVRSWGGIPLLISVGWLSLPSVPTVCTCEGVRLSCALKGAQRFTIGTSRSKPWSTETHTSFRSMYRRLVVTSLGAILGCKASHANCRSAKKRVAVRNHCRRQSSNWISHLISIITLLRIPPFARILLLVRKLPFCVLAIRKMRMPWMWMCLWIVSNLIRTLGEELSLWAVEKATQNRGVPWQLISPRPLLSFYSKLATCSSFT